MALKKLKDDKNDFRIELLRDVALMVGGKNAGSIVDLLVGKSNVNEFIIAKKLELTINQTRNILYKLSDEGLVSFIRKKDKKKGWYTYFWTFNEEKAFLILNKSLLNDLEQFERQLKSREQKRYYVCKTCNTEITEETALVHEFVCPECGEVYEIHDNSKAIREINNAILNLRLKLEVVTKEVNLMQVAREKKLVRDAKRELKKKKIERASKRAVKKAAKDKIKKAAEKYSKKTVKKTIKKTVKKKSVKKTIKKVKKSKKTAKKK